MKKTSRHVEPYPPEFRAEAIRLARTSGKSQRQIAEDLGMTSETLRLWLKQAELDEGKRQDGLTSDDQQELRRLRREVRILREEREILRKPRPSSLGRPTRPGKGVCVCGAREGPSSRPSDVPGAGCLPQRILGAAAARALCSPPRQRGADWPHRADPPESRGTYGALRMQAELKARGLPCGHNRVARLMHQAGLVGRHRRRPCTCTQPGVIQPPPQPPTWSSGVLPLLIPICSGSPTSRICRPHTTAFSIWR